MPIIGFPPPWVWSERCALFALLVPVAAGFADRLKVAVVSEEAFVAAVWLAMIADEGGVGRQEAESRSRQVKS